MPSSQCGMVWVSPKFFKAPIAAAVEAVELVPYRVFLIIVLVVFLGRIERRRRDDCRGDGTVEAPRLFQSSLGVLGQPFLLLSLVKDCRAVLVAPVTELA